MRTFFLGVLFFANLALTQAHPAQVILIRHAEKPNDPNDPHLSPAGYRRAEELVSFITSNPDLTKNGLPVALFASRPTKKGHGQRTQETIEPLAKHLALPIEEPSLSSEYKVLAKAILSDKRYKGKTVLICWTHERLPDLAAQLGAYPPPRKWEETDYDRVYSISYVGKNVFFKELSENLPIETERKGHKLKRHF